MPFLFPAVTNAAMDLSPVLLGVLFTLLLLCFVIFAKVYCFRAITTTNGNYSQNDEKHANNISYKKDEVGGLLLLENLKISIRDYFPPQEACFKRILSLLVLF